MIERFKQERSTILKETKKEQRKQFEAETGSK